MGTCSECPELAVDIGEGVDTNSQLIFKEWKKAPVPKLNEKGVRREIFSLHNTSCTMEDGLELLKCRVKELKGHIYTAYNQWEAKRIMEHNIKPGSLLILDDYQQNLTIELGSTPTSSVYGANQTNVMVFPAVLYYKREQDNKRSKASVTFVSDDLNHDHQQVWRMEARAVEILKDKTGLEFESLVRVSDGCGAQFKSRFCVADLCKAGERILGKSEADVKFVYFESNEGKGESDTRGSVFKMRSERMVLRDHNLVITSAKQLVQALNNLPPESTDLYDFTIIEEFPAFERIKAQDRAEVKLAGIRSLHQISFSTAGLKTSTLSCLSCARLGSECELCSQKLITIPMDKLKQMLVKEKSDTDEEQNVEEIEERFEINESAELLEQSDVEGEHDNEEVSYFL